ncbi:hypothetical protein D3C76_588840 [compost metagenome]
MDERHVVDADEAHDLAQVGFLVIRGAAGVDPAASGQYVSALAAEQALRAGFGVLEGHAGTQHVVEPGLKGARDGEVVHRRGHHQYVGGEQLISQFVGTIQRRLLVGVALLGRLHPAT